MFGLAFMLQADVQEEDLNQEESDSCLRGLRHIGASRQNQDTRENKVHSPNPLRQVDQQICVARTDMFVCICIHRTSVLGPFILHLHRILCPLFDHLSRMITFIATRIRPRTYNCRPGPWRHASARKRMCRGTSLCALLAAKAELHHVVWHRGKDAAACLGFTLSKPRYMAPA